VLEQVSGLTDKNAAHSDLSTQSEMALRLVLLLLTSSSNPPIRSAQSRAASKSSKHRRDGVFIVSPLKIPSII
jgi:hypothetical protein